MVRGRATAIWRCATAAAMAAAPLLFGTSGCARDVECMPACEGRSCGPDGCGGSCGACVTGSSCVEGHCQSDAPVDCSQSCAALGYACGEHCGERCGECPSGSACVEHACVCAPQCEGKGCGDDNGCGGACGGCPSDHSCSDCALRLFLVTDEVAGESRVVTLALDFAPSAGAPLPGLADLRLEITGQGNLERVALAPALLDGGKELFVHPATGRPFQRLREGVYRLLVTSPHNSEPLAAGRWLYLRLRLPVQVSPTTRPVAVRLLREAPVLAPRSADEALAADSFAGAVVLPLEAGHAD